MDVIVVGAGVIGLWSALTLTQHGHGVSILTRDDPLATTSAAAAASFKPRMVAVGPVTTSLLDTSNDVLSAWARDGRGDRIGLRRMVHVESSATPLQPRDYLHAMMNVQWLSSAAGDALPPSTAHAVSYETWFIDVPTAVPALVADLELRGVDIRRHAVGAPEDLLDVTPDVDVVVNATGIGAAMLARDDGLVAVRGQVVTIDRAVSDITTSVATDNAYVYPRVDDILLGGTADLLDAHELAKIQSTGMSPSPDPAVTREILTRAGAVLRALDPAVGAVESWAVMGARVGLRPWRQDGIRLDVDRTGQVPVVHAYGHGGAGWSLAAGTAAWVAAAVDGLG